jgi:hypothetical protein
LSDAPLAGLSVIQPLVTVQLESSRIGAANGQIDQNGDDRLSQRRASVCPWPLVSLEASGGFEQFETIRIR